MSYSPTKAHRQAVAEANRRRVLTPEARQRLADGQRRRSYPSVLERLTAKLDKTDGCWLWTGRLNKDGYGCIQERGRPYQEGVHRVTYRLVVGSIPEGMEVDHICWQRNCCNPAHLRLLPSVTNKRLQRRALKTHCVNGHPFSGANLVWRHDPGKTWPRRRCRTCERERTAR